MSRPPEHAPFDVLVLVAHPDMRHSRANRRLAQAAAGCGSRVKVHDLYARYPDYLIDVAAEQALLAPARLVVWQHPVHWYGMPPLMKLWLDEVLAFGWAYGPGGTALQGKPLWLVATTGSPEDSYHPAAHHRHFFDAFLPPYDQTAALCGMRFLPPLLIHGAHRVSDVELEQHAATYAHKLQSHAAWSELEGDPECLACDLPEQERPAGAGAGGPPGSNSVSDHPVAA